MLGIIKIVLLFGFLNIGAAYASCLNQNKIYTDKFSLSLIGNYYLDKDTLPGSFGGISGIDFNKEKSELYLVSDDKGEFGPARFYRVLLNMDNDKRLNLTKFTEVKIGITDKKYFDMESIRFDSKKNRLFISNEGSDKFLEDPSISIYDLSGNLNYHLKISETITFDINKTKGARANKTIEGMSISCTENFLWYSMEGSLIEDSVDSTYLGKEKVKIFRNDLLNSTNDYFDYFLDPIPIRATGGLLRSDNGISEILEISEDTLLVIERSGYEVSKDIFKFSVRIYLAKLEDNKFFRKKLLMNLDELNLPWIDNIESVSWGPTLSDGRDTLILFSDDNFSRNQINQLLFLAIN